MAVSSALLLCTILDHEVLLPHAIPHGTGSDLQTILSYDVSGNYFNLDMSLLEPGYEYGIKLAFYDSQRQSWLEQDQKFLFRVEDYEY